MSRYDPPLDAAIKQYLAAGKRGRIVALGLAQLQQYVPANTGLSFSAPRKGAVAYLG